MTIIGAKQTSTQKFSVSAAYRNRSHPTARATSMNARNFGAAAAPRGK